MNFEEFVKVYREDYYPRIRISTAANKDHIIDTKLVPYFKNFKVTEKGTAANAAVPTYGIQKGTQTSSMALL